MNLKAYKVYIQNMEGEGCILIFAEKESQAKTIFLGAYPFFDTPDYIDIRALREVSYDWVGYTREKPFYLECNIDLPDGCPPFFRPDNEILNEI